MKHTLAIVGFGGMAGWHYELIEKDFSMDELAVAGIWDIREERREYAASMGIHVYRSLEDLLADEKVDLVLIATPNDVHKSIAIQAMEAGKNVVSEKPVTLSSEDLREMTEASERTGRFLTVHQNRRWDEDFLTVKKVMEEGKLGEIFRLESRVHGSRGIPGGWRQEKEHGGGMVLDWGVHLFDQALLLFPGVKLKTVYATLTNVTDQTVDDGFTADLGFENGVHMIVEVGTSNFISLPRWYVLGTDGTAMIRDWGHDLQIVWAVGTDEKDVVPVRTAAGLTKTMAPRRDDSIHTESEPEVKSDIREFYRNVTAVLEGREESRIKMEEVARVMRLMEAVFQSARENTVVFFEA
ncbi:MAG: Gfo/Idh/MocA family oxidoreductase [Lachnospiraceae bacterium]|nr:Gfo/Idh/MocA family oxidoreductase [Lachnospiraceae bacterium]